MKTIDLKEYEAQIANIMAKVPANPFIIDLTGRAIQILAENVDENYFTNRLEAVSKVAEYVAKTSSPNFYKHHVLLASILAGVADDKYASLDTPAKTITTATNFLTNVVVAEYCKEKWQAVYNAGKADPDLLSVILIMLTDEVNKNPKLYTEDNIEVNQGLVLNGYVEVNLRKSSLTITNEMYPYYNAFLAAVNKAEF